MDRWIEISFQSFCQTNSTDDGFENWSSFVDNLLHNSNINHLLTLAHYLWNSFFNVCSKHLEISQSCRAFSSKNWIRFRVSLESEKPFDLDLSQIWLNFLLFWWDLSLQPSMWSQFWFALFSLLLLAESQASQFFSKSILVKIHGYDNWRNHLL